MRIIAGKYKGRNLFTEKDKDIRPTTDRVKENMFNLVQHTKYQNGNVLDLFCGSGALGVETLSRGASYCLFCDHSEKAIEVLKKNLANLDAKYDIFHGSYSLAISQASRTGLKFKLIILDPPYGKFSIEDILKEIIKANILDEEGIVIIERPLGDKDYLLPQGLYTLDSRDYGNITLDILALGDAVAVTGTFDPYTIGHDFLVEKALEQFKCVHIVLLDNPDKVPSQSKKMRKKRIAQAVRRYRLGSRIKVNEYDGLAIDYCKSNDIRYIIRGFRNEEDLIYEKNMADWNLKYGNIETILIEARDKSISSAEVRRRLEAGEDVSSLLVGD